MLCIIGQVRAIKLRVWPLINIFSQNVPESLSITTEYKNIILNAYSTQKVEKKQKKIHARENAKKKKEGPIVTFI